MSLAWTVAVLVLCSSFATAAENVAATPEPQLVEKTAEKTAEKTVEKAAESATVQTTAKTSEVETWVQQLGRDDYSERQAAMKNLRRSGTDGVKVLTAAARGSNLEVTARAIDLLAQLYNSADENVALAADDALESLAEHGPAVAVVRTQQVLTTTLFTIRRQHAITAIRRMGGKIIPRTDTDPDTEKDVDADLNEEGSVAYVVLDKKWSGGLAGLKYLQRLTDLKVLYVTKGIPLSLAEQDDLRGKLVGVKIEMRGSAYLGIKNRQIAEIDKCIVEKVVPRSPADKAGLQSFDEITHLDGLPVTGFTSLTTLLSEKQGGDVVFLEIRRGDDYLELEVTLAEW